jgi:outer membrane protein TolC
MQSKIIVTFMAMLFGLPMAGKAQQNVHSFNLKECIQYGLENHPSVRIYNNNVEKSHQTARQSLAAYLPQVNINAGLDDNLKLQQTIIPAGTFGPGTPERKIAFGTQYNSSMMVQLDQKIYDQSLLLGIKANEPNKEYAALQQEQNNESLIYDISSTYFQILVTQRQLSLLDSNKSRFEQILKVTKLQAEQGVAKKVDVKQVQVNLNNVLSQISTTKNNLEIGKNTLKNYMGLQPSDSLILMDTSRWLNQSPSLTPYPAFDYGTTLGGQIQKVQIELYDLQRKSIKAQAIPTLSLYARYGSNGFGNNFEGAYNPLLDYSGIGVKLSWNIFTGFRRDAQYKSAALDLNNARVNYSLNESLQNLQYQNAEARSNEARTTILTNKENMNLASEVYSNTTLQYREGVASLSDLLNAELSYREAQNNYINSLLNYYIADLAVKRANGKLEQYYKQL